MPAAPRDTKTKRTPFKPKEPLPVEQRLPKLYRGLVDQVEGSHFAGAIKTCRKSMYISIPGIDDQSYP
jgi:signal recognition particle subunit SRP72